MIMKKIYFTFLMFFVFILGVNSNEISQSEINILKNLRCLVCQGQSIADSNSDFAQTIKLVVKDQIKDGRTEKEIYDFLISKYGEWIFYKPSLKSHNMILWFGPYLMIFFGGLLIWKLIRKRKNNKVY
jgi:cytochrome c-type biogenesis protein CcmH